MDELLKISFLAYMFCALGYEENMIFWPYQQQIRKLPKWLSFPLGACHKCFAGQVCLWYWLIKRPEDFGLLLFIGLGIALSMGYNKVYEFLHEDRTS